MNPATDPLGWYWEIPPVSRTYLTGALLATALVALDVVSPFSFYFNWNLIVRKGQLWRLATNFLWFGPISLEFLFHMYFLVRYCRLLEEGDFRGRTADFVFLLIFGATLLTCVAPWLSLHFLGSSLSFMLVYIWGRRNEHVRMSFLGLFPFTAPYLPWVLLVFSLLMRNPLQTDMLGIAVGHLYYFLEYIYPEVAEIRGWRLRRIMRTPGILYSICGGYNFWAPVAEQPRVVVRDFQAGAFGGGDQAGPGEAVPGQDAPNGAGREPPHEAAAGVQHLHDD